MYINDLTIIEIKERIKIYIERTLLENKLNFNLVNEQGKNYIRNLITKVYCGFITIEDLYNEIMENYVNVELEEKNTKNTYKRIYN